jgi:4-amino-4-deoxy-L-arabinose transferase-like glycosyltransferase
LSRALGVFLVTGAAVAVAALLFGAGYPTPIYDGWGYYELSMLLRVRGLGAFPAGIRTYGYPLFTLIATGFRPLSPEGFRLVVFLAQLALYLGACALAARRLARLLDSPEIGLLAYALGALNPALLAQATEPLTDLLSAALILAAVALAWRMPGASRPGGPWLRETLPSFLCAGLAVAVRPANLAAAAGLAAAWALRTVRWKEPRVRALAAGFLAFVAPLLPQALARRAQTGAFLPLVDSGLYRDQAAWGMRALKYGTLVADGHTPFLLWSNPLYRGAATPAEFAAHDPLAYAGTLFLHGFAMVDRDLPFTYVTDLRPWYARPLAIANLLLLGFAVAALAAAATRVVRRRTLDEAAFAVLALVLVGGAYVAVYLPVAVEARFGAPLQALAPAAIGLGVAAKRGASPARARRARLAGAALLAAAAVVLSAWIDRQRSNPPDLRGLSPVLSGEAPRAPEPPAKTPAVSGR